MRILICTATEIEIDKNCLDEIMNSDKNQVEWLVTGMGAMATTYHLTKKINAYKPDLVINAGIAGSFRKEFSIGEVVQVTEDIFADMGFDDISAFKHISDMDYSQGWIKNKPSESVALSQAKGITVNTVTGSEKRISELKKLFNPDIETMESYVYFYICRNENIPLIALRAVSNEVGVRDKTYWNIPLAVHNLWLTLRNILNQIHE